MLSLYMHAPFAVCRPFTAGWYRPTAAFLTPSAAYGLLLNVAGIESRLYEHESGHNGHVPTSFTRPDLPPCRIAIGLPEGRDPPRIQSLFQQLHKYPVGKSGMPLEIAKGSKNDITPVRREILVDLHAILVVDTADGDLGKRILRGLRGELNTGRYGLPFVGDNNFLINRLEVVPDPRPARWYQRVGSTDDGPQPGVTRLTTHIDRADMSSTRSALYAPAEVATLDPPDVAWTSIGSG